MRYQKIGNLSISENEKKAIERVYTLTKKQWANAEFIIFGSKATKTSDNESDFDLLILLPCKITQDIKQKIIYTIFEINIEYDVNISPLIVSKTDWHSKLSVLPIHYFIEKEGIAI